MVSSGPRTGYPHGVATDRTLRAGEPVMIDIGVTVDGYGSDLTRTVHLGPPAAEFAEVHALIERAMEAAIRGVRPGRAGREIDALARAEIDRAGYGERFGHGLGHSVGLQGHEPPNFAPAETAELASGMVVTVEPGVYLPDRFGVRTEDMIVVTEDGCEVLTRAPRELKTV